jgi:hypothetical protein
MFQAPDPKSPLFDMVAGIVNAHAALVRAQLAEPAVTRIDFAPGHEDERLTDSAVAGKLLKMKAAGLMYEALRKTKTCALPTDVRELVNAAIAAADGRSDQEAA